MKRDYKTIDRFEDYVERTKSLQDYLDANIKQQTEIKDAIKELLEVSKNLFSLIIESEISRERYEVNLIDDAEYQEAKNSLIDTFEDLEDEQGVALLRFVIAVKEADNELDPAFEFVINELDDIIKRLEEIDDLDIEE